MKTSVSLGKGLMAIALTGAVAMAVFSGSGAALGATLSHDHDDGDRAHQTRDVAPFTHVRVKGGIELRLVAGKKQSVEISADSDHIDSISTDVLGNILTIDMDDHHGNFWDDDDVEVVISMERFEGIEVLGAVDGHITGVDSDRVNVEIKGAADLEIEGTCGTLDMQVKGAGDVDADGLKCQNVTVDVKGVGSVSVYASESVDAGVSGIGEVTVEGDPKKVHKRAGGIGTVRID